jgi:hypothetical protein
MRLRDMRRLVETDLRDLQKLLNRNPKTARAELARRNFTQKWCKRLF